MPHCFIPTDSHGTTQPALLPNLVMKDFFALSEKNTYVQKSNSSFKSGPANLGGYWKTPPPPVSGGNYNLTAPCALLTWKA